MIKFYTGTPGSGKSLHSIKLIVAYLKAGKNVISNFPLKVNDVPEMNGRYFYIPNDDLTVSYLRTFARMFHEEEQENQTLIVIDEASVKFNSRTFNAADRLDFCGFFAQHRKYGYEVVVISQTLRQVDRQIRDLCEIEVVHRKLNNYSLWRILPFPLFAAIERNITVKQKNGHELFLYDRKIGLLYDTFYDFTQNGTYKVNKAVETAILNSEIKPDADLFEHLSLESDPLEMEELEPLSKPLPPVAVTTEISTVCGGGLDAVGDSLGGPTAAEMPTDNAISQGIHALFEDEEDEEKESIPSFFSKFKFNN